MTEIWKPVAGYEGLYEISDQARLRRISLNGKPIEPRYLTTAFHNGRYVQAILCKDAKTRNVHVHTLVCTAFHGPSRGLWARHLDGDRSNNRPSNLRWGTPKENMRDQYDHGTRIVGVRVPNARLDDDKVREIREMYSKGISQTKIANIIGVSQPVVSTVTRGVRWGHVL